MNRGKARATDVARHPTAMADYGFIVIHANNDIVLIETDKSDFTLEQLQTHADCDTISIVRCGWAQIPTAPVMRSDLLMVIDDNGKIFHKPINKLATLLYGNPADFIVGDAVLGWTNPLEDVEPDIYPMPMTLCNKLYATLIGNMVE